MCLYTRTKAPSLDFIRSQLKKHSDRLEKLDDEKQQLEKEKLKAEKAKTLADIKEAIKAATSSNTKTTSAAIVQPKKDNEQAVKIKEA